MPALLPILAFLAIFILIYNWRPTLDWRSVFVRSVILWGAYLVLLTELFSLFRWVTQIGLGIGWSIPILAVAGWFIRNRLTSKAFQFPHWHLPAAWGDRLLLSCTVIALGITALVAWFSPPQTWDSLQYHLPRVTHWAQERAVVHFSTGIEEQNILTPGAEMVILQFYVLGQGDKLATFAGWFSLLGSVIASGLIARQLGAGLTGQLLASLAAATIPMGIIQASSTITDIEVGLWTVCAAAEALSFALRERGSDSLVMTALAAGLAFLTKPTALAYLLPIAIALGIVIWIRLGFKGLLGWGMVAFCLVLSLSAGHLLRNYATYGNPISDQKRIDIHNNELRTPQGVLSNLIRNAAFHTGTPWGRVNRAVYQVVLYLHEKLGISPEDPRTTSIGPYGWMIQWTNEDRAGNTFHAGLILVCSSAALIFRKRLGIVNLIYVLAAAATFLLFSIIFKWQTFGSRYHLPFFFLFAPVIGYTLTKLLPDWLAKTTGLLLLLAAIPWLFSIDTRPLIPGDQSKIDSILRVSRQEVMFANGLYLIQPYTTIVGLIRQADCTHVGLALGGAQAEYPLWVLLGAPRKSIQIEWMTKGSPSDRYKKPDFKPCAIICQGCTGETYYDLPQVWDNSMFRLYMKP